MQSTCPPLRLGRPVRFRDRWQGRLASFEVNDQWAVLNVGVSRGIFRPQQVRLPFSAVSEWDDDHVSLDCTSEEAFARELAPVARLTTTLSAGTLPAAEARLAGALVERTSRRVTHLILTRGRLAPDQRLAPVAQLALEDRSVRVAAQVDALPPYRRDADLLQAVRDALAAHPYLTADDRRSLSVEVVDGAAFLSGNVRTPQAQAFVHEAARSLRGLAAVHGGVVNDRQLEIDVGRALDSAGLFRYGRIYIRAALGEVTLGGFLNSGAVAPEVVRAVSAVPGVRSVEDRFELREAPPPPAAAPPGPPEQAREPAAAGPSTPEAEPGP